MDREGEAFGMGTIFGALLGGCMTVTAIVACGCDPAGIRQQVQNEATEAGAAEWRVDPKTGATSFHWIKEEK